MNTELKHSIVLELIKKSNEYEAECVKERKRPSEFRNHYNLSSLIYNYLSDKLDTNPMNDYIKILKENGLDEDNEEGIENMGWNRYDNQCRCCKFYFPSELTTDIECLYKPHKIYKTTNFRFCNFCRDIHLEKDIPITYVEDYETKMELRGGEYFLPLEGLFFDDWYYNSFCDDYYTYESGIADFRFFWDWTEENDAIWKNKTK